MAIGLLGRKVGMTQIFDESGQRGAGDGDSRPGRATCCSCARRSATATRRCSWAFSTSPAAWPVAVNVVMSPSSTASAPRRRAKAGVEPLPKADCEPQRFVREFRGSTEGLAVGQTLDVESLRRGQARRRHRHHQGPRHRRRHGAAQLPGPAGHARREESASPRRLDRPEPVPRPRAQGPPHGRPATATSAARCAI